MVDEMIDSFGLGLKWHSILMNVYGLSNTDLRFLQNFLPANIYKKFLIYSAGSFESSVAKLYHFLL